MIHIFIFLPMLASLLLLLVPVRWREEFAGFAAAATLGLGVWMWAAGGVPTISISWLPAVGVTYSVGMDGVSLLLGIVTALMSFIAIIYTARRIPNPGTMLSLILALETGLLGLYAARDLVLFYVFFEDALIPSLLMLAMFGKTGRMAALVKFGAYTLLGSMLMLVSIIGIKSLGGSPTFALADLLAHPVKGAAQTWLYLGFLAAMAVKLPLFPLHAWLPDFHEQNHDSGVADVMGTLYKVGAYGLFRFGMALFPDASLELRPVLMSLAAFTAIYVAWIAFRQTDWKRLLAYAGLSHMGLVGLGIFSMEPTAVTGAIYLLAFQNVYTGALFLAAGMLQERVGSLSTRVGGVMTGAPILAGVTMSLWFASIAVPGLAGFVGEFSILLGAYQISPWLAFIAGLSTIAAAIYALSAYQTTYWQARPPGAVKLYDLQHTEWLVLGVPLAVCVVFGVWSAPALHLIQPSVNVLKLALTGGGS